MWLISFGCSQVETSERWIRIEILRDWLHQSWCCSRTKCCRPCPTEPPSPPPSASRSPSPRPSCWRPGQWEWSGPTCWEQTGQRWDTLCLRRILGIYCEGLFISKCDEEYNEAEFHLHFVWNNVNNNWLEWYNTLFQSSKLIWTYCDASDWRIA